jgi:type II secretory pathway predicted ATPase ExeA
MFRREVLRQASARREHETRVRPLDADAYAKLNPSASQDLDALSPSLHQIGSELIEQIVELQFAHRGTLSAVIGERGAGKTTLLERIEAALQARASTYVHTESDDGAPRHDEYGRLTIRHLQCPPGGIGALQKALAASLGLERTAGTAEVAAELARQAPLVFLIDDAHRLVRPAIGGLQGLDRLADFARAVRGDASWVLSIDAAAWQYVSRARGERVFFDEVHALPRWSEQAIAELIRSRSELAKLRPSFDEIVIPRRLDMSAEAIERPTLQQRAEFGFYRILWDYAQGNPAVALHFWRESLWFRQSPIEIGEGVDAENTDEEKPDAADTDALVVRLFSEPRAVDLDAVGPTMHFVLRAVVQLETASVTDLVACTQLPQADVADALRYALKRSWIHGVGDGKERYRVSWHWYRAIADMLRRQHLLEI